MTVYLASVSRRTTSDVLVDIVVQRMPDADYITILSGVNLFGSGTITFKEYRPQLTKSTFAPNLVLTNDYSNFNMMRANDEYFVILSDDWLMKFEINDSLDESM